MKSFFLALLSLMLLSLVSRAEKLEPAAFQVGDRWAYDISVTGGEQQFQFQTEYSLVFPLLNGSFFIGERSLPQRPPWGKKGEVQPGQCMLFIINPADNEVGDLLCGKSLDHEQELIRENAYTRRKIRYRGDEELTTPAGKFKAMRITREEMLLQVDDLAPTAKTRTWQYWYDPKVRSLIKAQLDHHDAEMRVVRSLTIVLIDYSIQPAK